jgi:AcrR family transcriptional regulator
MSERRRQRVQLEVAREAARLFWKQGVDNTTGDQIADAVGLSTRTLWRYFSNKESCVEPVLASTVNWITDAIGRWPEHLDLGDHFAAELKERRAAKDSDQATDDLLAVQMLSLADTDPALRATWLLISDRVERRLIQLIAARLRRPADSLEVRTHAAAAAAAIRAVNEDISRTLLAGGADRIDVERVAYEVARAVKTATSGSVGRAIRPAPRSRGNAAQ